MADLDDDVDDKVAMTLPAFEVRARMAQEWAERTVGGPSKLSWIVRQHFEQDVPTMLAAIEAYRAGQAAAPDGPRTSLPMCQGGEVVMATDVKAWLDAGAAEVRSRLTIPPAATPADGGCE